MKRIILEFALQNWKLILIGILALALMTKMRHDYNQLHKTYETTQESLKAQIENLQSLHEEELRRKEAALEEYKDRLDVLEKEYEESLAELEEAKEEDIKKHKNNFSEDKEKLAEDIESLFGFNHVP